MIDLIDLISISYRSEQARANLVKLMSSIRSCISS